MQEPLTLDQLAPGHSATVLEVEGDDAIARRISDLGLWPGASVSVVRRAPLGDPIQVRIGGYHLALRRVEGRRVRLVSEREG